MVFYPDIQMSRITELEEGVLSRLEADQVVLKQALRWNQQLPWMWIFPSGLNNYGSLPLPKPTCAPNIWGALTILPLN